MEAPLESIRILVVDDEEPIVELLTEYLRARGHRLYSANDGEEALEVLDAKGVDLVLTDMKMPKMGGLDLLARIQERGDPVGTILMTGYGTIETAILAMKHGALDYLLKPFRLRDVHNAIMRAAQRIQLERETVRLHQVVKLYEAVHHADSPDELGELYCLLGDVAVRELGAAGALVAFNEPAAGWVEYYRTPSAPFATLDLDALGQRVLSQGQTIASTWFAERTDPVIAAPIRAQRGAAMESVGLLAVCGARSQGGNAASALAVYAGIVGDALSRQFLSGRLVLPEFTGRAERLAAWLDAAEGILTEGELDATREALQVAGDSGRSPQLRELLDTHRVAPGPPWAQVLLQRRERFDGQGSPRGVQGDSISPGAQWLALAERWEMLTRDRSFAPRLEVGRARAMMLNEIGQSFHPSLLQRFLERVTS